MAHFPLDLVVLAVLVLAVGIILFVILGRRIGAQGVRPLPPPAARKNTSFSSDDFSSASSEHAPGQCHIADSDDENRRFPPPLPGRNSASRKGDSDRQHGIASNPLALLQDVSAELAPADYVIPGEKTALAQKLLEVRRVIPNFEAESFLRQADRSFRAVVTGYAAGDRSAFAPYMTDTLLDVFDDSLHKRVVADHKEHCSLRHLERLEIVGVSAQEDDPENNHDAGLMIKVAITSWQVKYITNKAGDIIEGMDCLTEFRDLWSFVYEQAGSRAEWKLAESGVF